MMDGSCTTNWLLLFMSMYLSMFCLICPWYVLLFVYVYFNYLSLFGLVYLSMNVAISQRVSQSGRQVQSGDKFPVTLGQTLVHWGSSHSPPLHAGRLTTASVRLLSHRWFLGDICRWSLLKSGEIRKRLIAGK